MLSGYARQRPTVWWGARLPGTVETDERGLWKWSVSLYGSSVSGTWKKQSSTGSPKEHVKEGSGDKHLSL